MYNPRGNNYFITTQQKQFWELRYFKDFDRVCIVFKTLKEAYKCIEIFKKEALDMERMNRFECLIEFNIPNDINDITSLYLNQNRYKEVQKVILDWTTI